ncbi:GNAT family N-acetyltransferase [Vibrio parahaemolyticus]|nr:GNAT family N-acetyltransferase [Vibrio parahaemolyticus]ELB2742487.1 GNAT family N-acetyltransferase [Vibrio parahaemolyticus]
MLTIERLNESHIDAIRAVSVEDEQLRFAGTAEEFLQDGSDTAHLHVIKHHHSIVGFFKLDIAYSESYPFCPPDGIGLRFFVIDKAQQGKGLGTKAVKALFGYLKLSYPSFSSIYLTVNYQNPAAKACYLKGGFEESTEPYLGGPAGPQSIMWRKIA